jgi:hypothetical protein
MYLFLFPARTYLAQKQDIAGQEQTIAGIARAKYGLVGAGQQAFMVLPSQERPRPSAAPQRPKVPWYASLEFWHHL